MKHCILYLILLISVSKSFSQLAVNLNLNSDHYLQQSKNQKTAGLILLGAGTGAMIVGAIVQQNAGFLDFTGASIVLAGGVVDLISIPFFISAGANKRKAATFSLKNSQLSMPGYQNLIPNSQPVATISMTF